jgi:thiamine-phosphate pyrophosphorylase
LIPRLHLVTDDVVLQSTDFIRIAADVLRALERDVALHVRAHALSGGQLFDIVSALLPAARMANATLVVNERVDVALSTGAAGVQLNARGLPVARVRALLKDELQIGYSAHAADEAAHAARAGADFIFAGTIYQTASHAGQPAGGIALLAECVRAAHVPVLAIGGVTTARIPEILQSEAHGVAVIRAVWQAADPVQAARQFARLLES